MLLVGLTGGIGSGKSTVAKLFADRGAVIVDADVLARAAVEPGTPGFDRISERFGREVVNEGGEIDRQALAAIVFADESARRDLEAIVHPEVGRGLLAAIEAHRDSDAIVVFDAPLIVEGGFGDGLDALVVVTAPREEQVARLIRDRGMAGDEAEARIAAQSPTEEKVARADHVIVNDGSLAELGGAVDEVWAALVARERGKPGRMP
ncbi:MAG: dephospho-CoA kinase [Actinomycetota bacterium]